MAELILHKMKVFNQQIALWWLGAQKALDLGKSGVFVLAALWRHPAFAPSVFPDAGLGIHDGHYHTPCS